MQITGLIICLNEEVNIGRCLESLQGIADEILVLDSGSTDRTEEIVSEFKAKFISTSWEGYAATKNKGHAMASNPFILSIDADEVLSPQLKSSILSLDLSRIDTAYSFNRLNNYCGTWIKHAGWYPDTKVRLYPKDGAEWRGEFVHEELLLKSGLKTQHLSGDLLHYSYYSVSEHIEREKKYAKLAAQKDKAKGKSPSFILSYLRAFFRFFKMYILKLGILHGRNGYQLCLISAKGKIWRHKYLVDSIRS